MLRFTLGRESVAKFGCQFVLFGGDGCIELFSQRWPDFESFSQ
jgi:hypothetical protein